MKINAAGLALIKEFESLKLTAYRCPAGVLTIGYGSTGPHVREGMTITKERAEAWLKEDVSRFEREVERRMKDEPTRNQFSALVSLCFNVGPANFAKSTLLKHHNAGNVAKAAEQFMVWNKATGADGVKRELKGLTRRRAAEAALYLTPTDDEEAEDPQRTRASDVEPSPVNPPPVSGKALVSGAAVSGTAALGIQAVSQVSTIWSWLTENGIEPKVVLAVLGVALVGIGVGLVWKLLQARKTA